jgi:hypothetical protein
MMREPRQKIGELNVTHSQTRRSNVRKDPRKNRDELDAILRQIPTRKGNKNTRKHLGLLEIENSK